MVVKRSTTFLVKLLCVVACSCSGKCGNGSHDGNLDAESDVLSEDVTTADTNLDGVDSVDSDITDSVSFDPVDAECRVLDYESIDLGTIEYQIFTPSRSPSACGDNCRQVSVVQDSIEFGYDVDGDYVVFTTRRNEGTESVDSRLNIVRLSDSSHMYITREQVNDAIGDSPGWFQELRRASVSDSKVVFFRMNMVDAENYKSDLLVYHLDSRQLELVRSNAFYYTISSPRPRFEHTLVALYENALSDVLQPKIITFDLESREECIVSVSDCCVSSHRIHDGRVVFIDRIVSDEVYLYDSAAKQTTQLTLGTWDRVGTRIWEDRIVWTDMREGGTSWSLEYADIYLFDTVTGEESALVTHEASQVSSDIWGERVVWEDCRNDLEHPNVPSLADKDLFIMDLTTGVESHLISIGHGGGPRIIEDDVWFLMYDDAGVMSVFEVAVE